MFYVYFFQQAPFCFFVLHFVFLLLSLQTSRLCVSASQDGKLIVWDTITTNKVRTSKGVVSDHYTDCHD